MFIVRKYWNDPKSETIAKAETYRRAYDDAMILLMDAERDYEAFDMVEVDKKGKVIEILDCVSWEPRG